MNSLVLSLLAAGCASLSSLFYRKNADASSTPRDPSGYLVLFYLTSFVLSVALYPAIWTRDISYPILAVGVGVGLLSSLLMLLTFHALKQGPAGLTYTFQNASAIFPGLLLFLVFGSNFGYSFTLAQLLGMMLVLLGLFIGTRNQTDGKGSPRWLKFALACFILQILALTTIQARCVLFDCNRLGGMFTEWHITEADDIWFMPGLFGTAFIIQGILFLRKQLKFNRKEALYGLLGGSANFGSTLLLLLATKVATPFENGILFPCFAVATLILCNFWAYKLYAEKFHMRTNVLCSLGIFLAAAG